MAAAAVEKARLTRLRHPLLVRVARNRVAGVLVRQHGLSWSEAREQADAITEDVFAEVAADNGAEPPAGGFMAWLLEFIRSDTFQVIVKILLALLGFAVLGATTPAPVAAVEPESV